jgi:hypothetical protein
MADAVRVVHGAMPDSETQLMMPKLSRIAARMGYER